MHKFFQMKTLVFDLLNGLTIADLTLMLIQVMAAMLLGQFIRLSLKMRNSAEEPSLMRSLFLPVIVCFLVIVSKNSAPLSISLLGLFVFSGKLNSQNGSDIGMIVTLLLGVAGFGCGSGFVAATFIFYLVLVIPILLFISKN